jgi:hypothetical protein
MVLLLIIVMFPIIVALSIVLINIASFQLHELFLDEFL